MPCGTVVLCGINSRFQLLSPCVRQVTHALLTRPPLKWNESNRNLHQNISVRLACVKHAASVHPEPGSNSQKKFWEPCLAQITLIKTQFLELKKVRFTSSFAFYSIFKIRAFPLFSAHFFVCLRQSARKEYNTAPKMSSTFFELFWNFLKSLQTLYSIKLKSGPF